MKTFLLTLFLIVSCSSSQTTKENAVLQTILKNPKMKKFFHLELDSRTPLYLLDNEYLDENLKLTELEYKVVIVNDTSGTNRNYLEIVKLDIKEDEAKFAIYYKIEGTEIYGTLKEINGEWKVKNISYLEF
ncbi:MAG TPA: hypothetical protein VF181_04510 [Balneolaceae bacterium]